MHLSFYPLTGIGFRPSECFSEFVIRPEYPLTQTPSMILIQRLSFKSQCPIQRLLRASAVIKRFVFIFPSRESLPLLQRILWYCVASPFIAAINSLGLYQISPLNFDLVLKVETVLKRERRDWEELIPVTKLSCRWELLSFQHTLR